MRRKRVSMFYIAPGSRNFENPVMPRCDRIRDDIRCMPGPAAGAFVHATYRCAGSGEFRRVKSLAHTGQGRPSRDKGVYIPCARATH